MKKRILSILLCLCMVACMLPTVAFAADTGKAIRLVNTNNPTGGILGYKNNNNSYDYIYMGSYNSSPVKWRVLDDQTNTGATGLFLLSEDLLGSGGHGDVYDVYFDGTSPYSNAWQGSDAQGWCNTFESSNLDSRELAAILSTTKSDEAFTSSTHNASFAASTNILNSDQVFFLSAQEAENGQYGFTDEAARVANYGAYASVWWLRSPFAKFTSSAGAVDGFGRVYDCGVGIVWAARPAFNLNLNSVLFTSAAVGGKPDGGLTAVPEYSGNEWKLTLLDSSRNFAVTEKAVSTDPNDTITLNYSGATTGANEYISAIIADNNGAQYYGRVAQPTAESGTVEIKIPSDIAPGNYTLKVFSEQYNGDYKTDYASNFTDIALTVEKQVEEQFSLTPGGTYYFDLSGASIPGTANSGNSNGAASLPDTSLHYVPFTYAGTIEAYKLTSAMATTEEYAQQNKYSHSLFVADYAVTHKVNWNNLDTASLIFGKNYASGGVDYTLRAPSVGSSYTGSGDSTRGTPLSNEWDRILDKDSGYIKNGIYMHSWGQDTHSISASYRAIRGFSSARLWLSINAALSDPIVGFRPVLEVLNPGTLGSDGLKVVTLDLGGGKLGGSSDAIHIIVKNGSAFTAPASDGLTRPDGDTGSYFMWLGSDGKLYAPGDNVPADVTKLTAQFALSEQFSLTPGGRYYFDLSAMNIPGTANGGNSDGAVSLPDTSLHYVPFTYVGTIEAYKLTSEMATTEEYAQQNKYPHSLFVADYAVTHTISWGGLNDEGLIFGKNYASGGVDYTLRAPSVGSSYTGSGDSERGTPQSNEWDTMLNKNSGYIQNWNKMYSWGQDVSSGFASFRALRGYDSARTWDYRSAANSYPFLGFRPVLEVLNPDTLGSDGMKVVTLDLNGGKLGGSSEDIQIIVKKGIAFAAPASDGLNRPDGDTGSYFMWLDGNGNSYEPGGSVPADVTELTVQWTAPTYVVTLNTNGGTINSGNVTGYTYGVGATLPTADDMTYTGYTFKGWYDNEGLTGFPVTAISDTETGNKEYWAKWEANAYTVTLNTNGGTINNGNVTEYTYGAGATLPTADDMTYTGHTFVGWYDNENLTGSPIAAIGGTETGNKEYWAKWEANTYTVTFYPNGGSVNPVAATTDSSGKLSSLPTPTRGGNYRFDGWYTEQTGGIKVTLNQVYTADTTLYAYWIYTSGSSSSEDRDDPSGNAFITDRPNKDNPTTPTTAKSNSVKVDSKGNAVITRSIVADVISVAQSDSIKHGNTKNGIAVVVPVEISKALAGVQITLKADALDKLVSSGVKRFTIDTDSMADFGFMLDTLKELNRQTTGDLILKMKKTAVTSQEVETAIGNRPVYDITLWEVKNGKETAVNLSGKTVSIAIPYTPAKNEKPGNLYAVYVDENGNVQWISKSSYNMDQKAVIFVAEHFSIYGIGYKNQIPAFTDVNNHWAKDNMLFVVSRGLLSGTSATTFSPNTGMTRGMFVTALGRLAGVDPTDYQASMFTDVKEDAYYAPYVNWAAKTGVVSGTTDTTFAPDTNINREQMAVIMKNYATKLGYTIPKTLEVVNFADSAGISSWAKEAVKSMQQAGILAGKTNNCFDPAGTATRAEVATVLRRFVEIVIDPQTANGWVQNDSGEWSYYKNGDLVKGWLSNDQKWYWLDKNTGKMFSGGWKQIDGKQYYFYADGSMAVNTTVDGKTIGADGARK